MTVHVRTLLVPVALCWVAPLPAQQPAPRHETDCPYERAAAAAKSDAWASGDVVVKAETPLLDHRGPAALLLP